MGNKIKKIETGAENPNSYRRGIRAAAFTSMACVGYSLVTNDYSTALPSLMIAMPALGIGYLSGVFDTTVTSPTKQNDRDTHPENHP